LFGACFVRSDAVVVESGGILFYASFDFYGIMFFKCIGDVSWRVVASFRIFWNRSGC
jgi:hypothetical protein